MKKLIAGLMLALCAAGAQAQFISGQVLTAAALNAAFLGIGGGTLTGPLTINGGLTVNGNASVTGTVSFSHAAITGGTIDGTPIGSTTPSTGAFTTGNFSGAMSSATSVSSPSIQTNLQGWPTQLGTYWQSQFHANWNVVQSQIPNNPTEWQVYTNAAQGIAQTQNGTNQLVLQSGTSFNSAWVGLPYLYCDGTRYKVATFTDASHITVQTPIGGTVSFGSTANCTYYFVATTTTSVVNVNGTAVTYVSGQPFVSIFDGGQVYINGTAYTATYNSPTSITLGTNLGTLTGATLNQYANINNELATLRLQGLNGANEQNGALTFRPDGFWIQTLYAGQGKYTPMFFSVGENPAGTISPLISLYPAATIGNPGTLSLGGTSINQAMQVAQDSSNVDYWNVQGAHAGGTLNLSAAGTDTNIPIQISPKGTGVVTVSGTVTIAETSASLNLNDTSGTGFAQLNYDKAGSQYWAWANNSSSNIFSLNRFNAGTFTDSPISVSPSTGLVTLADGAAITGGSMNNASIGATTASTGRFTTLTATGAITPSSTAGIVGTTTNDNANAGSVGECVSSTVVQGSAVALTNNTAANVTSISLTAGDWRVWGSSWFTPAAATTSTQSAGWISTSSATVPVPPNSGGEVVTNGAINPGTGSFGFPTGMIRLSLASTTTVYLSAYSTFGTSTMGAFGFIEACRAR